jgi:hypothetical protein
VELDMNQELQMEAEKRTFYKEESLNFPKLDTDRENSNSSMNLSSNSRIPSSVFSQFFFNRLCG